MHRACLVDMALFVCTLTVMSVAGTVDLLLSHSNLSPPIVTLTLFGSALSGLIAGTNLQYALLSLEGILFGCTKKMVFVPFFIRVPTPCANLPRSLASAFVQIILSGSLIRWRYSRMSPVVGSITAFISGSMMCGIAC